MHKILNLIFLYFLYLSSFAQSPGNVSANLQWWFKANDGVRTMPNSQIVNKWINKGNFQTKEIYARGVLNDTNNYPIINYNSINYNSSVSFIDSNCSCFRTQFTDTVNMNPTAKTSTNFIVFSSLQNKGNPSNNVHYYNPSLISTESSQTTSDFAIGFSGGTFAIKADTTDYWSSYSKLLFNDNIPHLGVAARKISNSISDSSDLILDVDGRDLASKKKALGSSILKYPKSDKAYFRGFSIGAEIETISNNLNGTDTFIAPTCFKGNIAEVITYDRFLSDIEMIKVNSYLAIKYGITLNPRGYYNYLDSKGNIIWNCDSLFGYNNDVAGIGIDSLSGLFQPKSRSVNFVGMVTMGDATDISDGEFLIWGDNGLGIHATNETYLNALKPVEAFLERKWKVQLTGNPGKVNIWMDLDYIPSDFYKNDLVLLFDKNPDFSTATKYLMVDSLIGKKAVWLNVDFNNINLQYFTLGTLNQGRTPLMIKEPFKVYQYISPNNDSNNDSFYIENIELYPENELYIFSHDGVEVYYKKQYRNGDWKLDLVPSGAYYYVLTVDGKKYSDVIFVQR